MARFLRENGPWSLLTSQGHVELRVIEPGRELALTPSLAVTPLAVPHRDELSDTVGFRIRGASGTLLYVPDIDKWDKWERRIEDEVARVDHALLDGTFESAAELPGRSMAEVPHPLVPETRARLAALGSRVAFVHLNHTNRLLWEPAESASRAFRVCRDGEELPL
jgi:pyrroloquinoline quinone biosynthesis protein B